MARLQTTANLLSKAFIIPMFNRKYHSLNHTHMHTYASHLPHTGYGNIGLPLPMIDGISFTDTAVKLGKVYTLRLVHKYKAF